jgi:uncharacterized protein YegP (UPF0339 family)
MSGVAKYSDPFPGKDGKWYFHLKAANGEVVSQSEGYESREGAAKGIEAAATAAQRAASRGAPLSD